MRYVPISCLREGMIVAKSLYNTNNKLLVRRGFPIKQLYLERIKSLGYQGVYIEDDLSEGLEIKDIISNELRRTAIYTIKDVFTAMNMSKNSTSKSVSHKLNNTKKLIENIVYDIINNENTIVNMVDIKLFDEYTFFHSVNVAILSIVLGQGLKLSSKELYDLGIAAVLHDIGKVYIDKEILLKNGELTEEEYETVQKHSEFGYRHLKNSYEIPIASYVGVLQHHEKYDGTGYPQKKKKEEISLFGRIICIADVYDAITSNRPYRKAMLPSEAMEYIMANSGSMFDENIVKVFINKIAAYPIGTMVKLSNGVEALVIENNNVTPLRPVVKIYKDEKGNEMISSNIINLGDMSSSKNITIVDLVH
ncbi:MAG: HD-GYP domain-containing protein [Firmicutes bacterium HGW-Firmicutes-7]|nr:MAG: HD-GYP domain-containing protein [Firmicutes bacterium HGW-Firmicutes-7]